MKPVITIGIPTYNRSKFLSESLASALNQSFRDVEILISDNASTDNTEEVVASMRDSRVKYVKHKENQGIVKNVQNLLDMTTTEYFSLLQDDDMMFPDLISRVCNSFYENPDASLYMSYAIFRKNIGFACNAGVYGPPFILDWIKDEYRKVDGNQIIPMCLFLTPSIPPVTAYKTDILRKAFAFSRPQECILLAERTIVAYASFRNQVIIDPYIGGWFRAHPNQASVILTQCNTSGQRDNFQRDWEIMQELVSSIVGDDSELVCKRFEEWIHEAPIGDVMLWGRMVKQSMLSKRFSFIGDDQKIGVNSLANNVLNIHKIGVDPFVEKVLDILLKRASVGEEFRNS